MKFQHFLIDDSLFLCYHTHQNQRGVREVKKPCRICVENTRFFELLSAAETDEEDFFPETEEEEELYFAEDLPTDRTEDTEQEIECPALPEPIPSHLTTLGIYSVEKDGSKRITYEETEITGLEGNLTTFCLSPSGMLILLRSGRDHVCMVFENGARHLCDFDKNKEGMNLTLHTHRLESELDERGGRIFVEYSLELFGVRTEKSTVSLTVQVLDDEIK